MKSRKVFNLSGCSILQHLFFIALFAACAVGASAQEKTVSGTVVDKAGESVIGANVLVKGTSNGTITDLDGKFTLSNVPDDASLEIRFIGYKVLDVPVKGQTTFNVTLEEDAEVLDEVVVVGYGTMKKSDLTGAVASVNTDDIVARGSVGLAESLQGSAPGVDISMDNSRAGGNSVSFQIRGQASINKQADPLFVVDGIVASSIDYLNPQDIERVDVLKDASSTAIYGSRASAGVVMITTKGAKANIGGGIKHATVSYDGYYGIKKVARMPDFMDSREFMDYRFAKYTEYAPGTDGHPADGHPVYDIGDRATSVFPVASGNDYRTSLLFQRYLDNTTFDWQDQVLRTAKQQNHFISLDGATDNTNYRVGVGYQDEENVFVKNDYQRLNFKGAFDSRLSKVIETGMSVNLAYTVQKDFTTDNSSDYSPYSNAFWFAPILSPWDENGKLYPVPGKPDGTGISFTSTPNPLIDFILPNAYENTTRKFHVFGNFYVRFNIYDGLKFTTTFSPSFYHGRQGTFFGTGVTDEYPAGSSWYQKKKYNQASIANTDRLDWTWDNQVDYSKTFGDHSINAMGLFSMYKQNYETSTLSGRNIADDKLTYHSLGTAGTDGKSIDSNYREQSLVSVAARLNYGYKDKYLLTVTGRADGSSKFAKGNRWGFFPSAAVAWRASEEDFLKSQRWLNNLKVRLSYGITGNNNVGEYETALTAGGPDYAILGGSEYQGYYPGGIKDLGLQWEKVKEFDAGIDFSVLDNRIGVTLDGYRRLSDSQIMGATIPMETGETTITTNIGSVRNAGIELALNLGIFRTKDFTWDVGINFSRNWNEIKELPNGNDVGNNWFIGEPLNVLRDYVVTDVIDENGVTMHTMNGDRHYTLEELAKTFPDKYWYEGNVAVNDWNDDGKITEDDKYIYACKDPKWIGSLSSSITFKGFDFSFLIYTKQGQWSRSYFHEQYADISDRGRQKFNMDYYIPAGTPVLDHATGEIVKLEQSRHGSYPYPNNSEKTGGGYFAKGNAAIQYHETSFVKVKNITLGYTFPKAWMEKLYVKHLRLYLNITNPFCWTDYDGFDPEWADATLVNGGPASVTYQIGANIKF